MTLKTDNATMASIIRAIVVSKGLNGQSANAMKVRQFVLRRTMALNATGQRQVRNRLLKCMLGGC